MPAAPPPMAPRRGPAVPCRRCSRRLRRWSPVGRPPPFMALLSEPLRPAISAIIDLHAVSLRPTSRFRACGCQPCGRCLCGGRRVVADGGSRPLPCPSATTAASDGSDHDGDASAWRRLGRAAHPGAAGFVAYKALMLIYAPYLTMTILARVESARRAAAPPPHVALAHPSETTARRAGWLRTETALPNGPAICFADD